MLRNKITRFAMMCIIIAIITIPAALPAISEATMMFLSIEPGSRANGMGNAYVGVVDDAYAGWWNPAAAAFNRKVQFAGMHSNWLQDSGITDLYYEYIGWNQYFEDIGNLGLNAVMMDYGSQDQTDEQGNLLGTFASYEFALNSIYAYDIKPKKIGLGIGFKFLYSNLGPGTGETEEDKEGKSLSYAFDLGAKFKDVYFPRFDIGLVLQNIGPDVTYINEAQKDPLPMTFRVGLAYRVFDTIAQPVSEDNILTSFKQKLTLSADASKILANNKPILKRLFYVWNNESAWTDDDSQYEFESTIFSVGAEYNYLDLISLRGGYFYDKAGSITGPSFGVGFNYTFSQRYKIFADFAMITGGELADYNKTFSLGLEF